MAVNSIDFALSRYVAKNLLYGGLTQVREMGEPRWRASFTYAPMRRAEFQALQAWLDSLRGGLRTFLGHDALKPFPLSYRRGFDGLTRAAGGAFDGTGPALLTADTVGVSTLPAGFLVKAGDMIGLIQGTKRGLYRVLEDATASAGGSVTVTVEPRVNTTVFLGAGISANFARPACLMTLDPDSISALRTVPGFSPISFSGIQAVY